MSKARTVSASLRQIRFLQPGWAAVPTGCVFMDSQKVRTASGSDWVLLLMKNTKLDRRNFLKTTAVGAAGLSLLANTATDAVAEPLTLPDSPSMRRIIPLNRDWLYSQKSSPEALQPGFNDKSFARVTIPHTNKMLPASGFDE